MVPLQSLLAALELVETGDGRYRADNADAGHGVVFGGQLLAQSLVAALLGEDDKQVKTIHTVFARSGSTAIPVEIDVEAMHTGRAFASSTVTIRQGERLLTRSLVLSSADEPDVIRHADPAPSGSPPDLEADAPDAAVAWQIKIVGDVDLQDPDLVGPPDLDVWLRYPNAPDDPAIGQALLAFASDAFLIGTAMRPHEGVGQAQAHVTLSTGVVSHTLTFHEPLRASDWLLLSHHSDYAGGGRCHGRADVFSSDGTLAASFVQDGMIRRMDQARGASL